MKKREVRWTRIAERDAAAIVEYLLERSPEAAQRVWSRIEDAAATLCSLTQRGRVVPELKRIQIRRYRELIVAPYRTIFRVSDSTVYIIGVLDGRRNLEDLLIDRAFGME